MRQYLVTLQKARHGEMKPGHKYHSRRRDPHSGAWIYDYGHGHARAQGGDEPPAVQLREPTPPTFYATIDSDSIRSYMPAVPMLVPVSSWVRKAKLDEQGMVEGDIPAPKLPAHIRAAGVELGADGGGFVAARKWGGEYHFTPKQYVDWLKKVKPTWAAMLDFCVEPAIAATPDEVARRQDKTTANAKALWKKYKRAPFAWVPTVQGWSVEDYVRHARALKPLIDEMQAHYGPDAGFRVGVGTLCCRTSRKQIEAIVGAVAQELPGVPLHLWGVKLDAFKSGVALPATVISSDSAAWSQRFGTDIEKYQESGLTQREHAYNVALPDYMARIEAAHATPKQHPIDMSHELYDWQKLDPEKPARPILDCPACGSTIEHADYAAMDQDERDEVRLSLQLGTCPSCQSPLSSDEFMVPARDPDLDLPEDEASELPAWWEGVPRERLKKPKKDKARDLARLLGEIGTERMELSRGHLLVLLQKSHKYTVRRKGRGGQWVYEYGERYDRARVLKHIMSVNPPAQVKAKRMTPASWAEHYLSDEPRGYTFMDVHPEAMHFPAAPDMAKVHAYREQDGEGQPPIVVDSNDKIEARIGGGVHDQVGGRQPHTVIDGKHRAMAAALRGDDTIPALVPTHMADRLRKESHKAERLALARYYLAGKDYEITGAAPEVGGLRYKDKSGREAVFDAPAIDWLAKKRGHTWKHAPAEKSRKGSTKPGHKYISRKRGPRGKWLYDYGEARSRQETLSAKLGGMKARIQAQQPAKTAPAAPPALIVPRVPTGSAASLLTRLAGTPTAPEFFLAPDPVDEPTIQGKLDKIERAICARPLEEAHVFSLSGHRILAKRGREDDHGQLVEFSNEELASMLGCILTHNHPMTRDGSSFSQEDIEVLLSYGLYEIRAVGQKYRYSMKIADDRVGFVRWSAVSAAYEKVNSRVFVDFRAKIVNGEMTTEEANVIHRHLVWSEISADLGLVYKREEWSQ